MPEEKVNIPCSLYDGHDLHDVQLATACMDLLPVRHNAKTNRSTRRNALDNKLKVGNE